MTKRNPKKTFLTPIIVLFLVPLLSFTSSGQTLPTAQETAKAMTFGWNLGNTLEAIGGETAWGNPLATQELIDAVKAAGFNTIRLPCSWDIHADQTTLTIDPAWMARVKQVVDYCIKDELYVILNIHWDNGWLENNCTPEKQASVNIKQNTYWTQISNYFKGYDGHLLFAGANEPNVENEAQMAVLMSYHQTFINAVRATGGNNSSRVLIVQGPSTDIEKTNKLMHAMPADKIANRLMAEIHYYTPYQFCLMTEDAEWGKMFYYWGSGYHSTTDFARNATWGEEAELDALLLSMKTKFIDKGIPVVMGEFAANKRTSLSGAALALHTASREYFYTYLAKSARCKGLIPVYWDPGFQGNNSSTLFDRNTAAVVDQGAMNALMKVVNCGITAAEDVEEESSILFFPNPFSTAIEINLARPGNITHISILDMFGNVVETIEPGTGHQKLLLGASLPSGMYTVRVLNAAEKTQTFKVSKITDAP